MEVTQASQEMLTGKGVPSMRPHQLHRTPLWHNLGSLAPDIDVNT